MKINFQKELNHQNCIITVSASEIESGNYMEAIKDFGEVAVNFGGAITDGAESNPNTYTTLPNVDIKLSSLVDKPFEQRFIYQQYEENTQKYADAWVNEIKSRIASHIAVLSKKVDTFSGNELFELGI